MLEGPAPRLYGTPPGTDMARALIAGLEARLAGQPPEALARVEIFLASDRLYRRVADLLARGPARLWPRLRLLSDLGGLAGLPPPVPALRRQLELMQLVEGLLRAEPDLAPRSAAFDLAASLAELLDEMQGEGVAPAALDRLDLANHSAHWERARRFIGLVAQFAGPASGSADGTVTAAPDAAARARQGALALAARWAETPPDHPVIVAGSTGSRGATALFLKAVARLPQGALIFPAFDFDMPAEGWAGLDDALSAEDHPQYRFAPLIAALGACPADVRPWADAGAPGAAQARLVSLALRPAPVTDRWRAEGGGLGDLLSATAQLALIEAPGPRAEALAIALVLREAVEAGQRAALVTPDRGLARQVSAALGRWGIVADDSAGTPLHLTPPGRLVRMVAEACATPPDAVALVALLKHPLVASCEGARGAHLAHARAFELWLRAEGAAFSAAFCDAASLGRWAGDDPARAAWAGWLEGALAGMAAARGLGEAPLGAHLAALRALVEALAAGPGAAGETAERGAAGNAAQSSAVSSAQSSKAGSGALWNAPAGQAVRVLLDGLATEAGHGGAMGPRAHAELVATLLAREEVRAPGGPDASPNNRPDGRVAILGPREARAELADLVIIGGLNEGVWPASPPPDPWLNRAMRLEAGLLLPERRIGLAAHDFQHAACAGQVVLSRAVRDAEAETVPARWLNRLTNLMGGLPAQGGPDALAAMRARGARFLALAEGLDRPDRPEPPAPRPSPRPPLYARPERLSVTAVERLIRDPYAVYARHILRLRPLPPLAPQPDAPLRGTLVHAVMERFIAQPFPRDPALAEAQLLALTEQELARHAPWPATRRLWLARMARVAGWFVAAEAARRAEGGTPLALERGGRLVLPCGFTLTAEADRIDELPGKRLAIYDYKTGKPPTTRQMDGFDKQLLLSALIAARGGFEHVGAAEVARVVYIGLGFNPEEVAREIGADEPDTIADDLGRLIARYRSPAQGYTARNHLQNQNFVGEYDHLSRHGEWDEADAPTPIEVGR